jgi:hypothetical protein
MAMLSVTINGQERQIDTDDLTIGFYEDLEQAQASGKMRDFIPVLAGMLQISREEVREITLRQWKEIAESFSRAAAVPPTSA